MILAYQSLIELARNCPDDKIIVMPRSTFPLSIADKADDFWHYDPDLDTFVHVQTKELLDPPDSFRFECVIRDNNGNVFIPLESY